LKIFGYVEESELVEVCLGGSVLQCCPPEFARLQELIFWPEILGEESLIC
jgi:hypothetical protein